MSKSNNTRLKKGLGILLAIALIVSVAGVGFGTRKVEGDNVNLGAMPTFSASTYRRPAPNVTVDATDVIRVGASGTTTMGPGNSIRKATQSGVPEISAGSFQSQALAGETAYSVFTLYNDCIKARNCLSSFAICISFVLLSFLCGEIFG